MWILDVVCCGKKHVRQIWECLFFFFKQKTAYEIKECDWSSDVCSSDLSKKKPKRGKNGIHLLLIRNEGAKKLEKL